MFFINGYFGKIEISGKNWIGEEMEERLETRSPRDPEARGVRATEYFSGTHGTTATNHHPPFGSGRGVGEQPRICPVAGPGHRRRKGIGCVYLKNDLT